MIEFVLPTLDASLNFLSFILLIAGYRAIRAGRRAAHKKIMTAALLSSTLFLTCYLIYHAQVGSVPYPFHDWTRPIYYTILVPHVLLAAIMTPFIILLTIRAWRGDEAKHKSLARKVWPVWVFVSITGVIVYAMLCLRSWL